MRKGALKKKQRQLEELHLDRREALGELVLGMYVQGSWDDDLLERGAAEVAEVERELRLLTSPARDDGSGEQPPGEATGEHDFPATGEHTIEHDLPPTGEHVLRRPGEHTEEHLLPSWREEADATPQTPSTGPDRPAGAEEAAEPGRSAESAGTKEPPASSTPSGQKPEPAPAARTASPPNPPTTPKPPVAAAQPPATAPIPAQAAAGTPTDPAPQSKTGGPDDPLERLSERIEADQRSARNAIEAAKATLKTESRTETAVIAKEVAENRDRLTTALKETAALIAGAEDRAAAAEARLARESATAREAAADWVRGQAAEIEADAALAVEIQQEDGAAEDPVAPDGRSPVLAARVAALEAELAAEKAAKTEALVKAEARLKEIEADARAAEERVAAAAEAAAAAPAVATVPPDTSTRSEAEAREAAVAWLRGQIGALRKELADRDRSTATPAADETERGDS